MDVKQLVSRSRGTSPHMHDVLGSLPWISFGMPHSSMSNLIHAFFLLHWIHASCVPVRSPPTTNKLCYTPDGPIPAIKITLRYPHCMWKVPSQVSGFNGQLKYVDSCPNEPVPAKAFCYQHCSEEAEKQGIPTNLHEYKPAQGRDIGITQIPQL